MYKRILGPLDGSKLSESSLVHIKSIAKGSSAAEVILLMVIEEKPPSLSYTWSGQEAAKIAEQREKEEKQARQEAEDYLAGVADILKKEGVSVRTVVASAEPGKGADETILDFIDNNKVDLIVMSTHGRSGITRWAFGSVTDRVIRHARIPVLTVTPAGYRGSRPH